MRSLINKDDLEYASVCQYMVSGLGKELIKLGEALKSFEVDEAGAYKAIGSYIGDVKHLDEKFRRLVPSERMRFYQKSFRSLMDAHIKLSRVLYTSQLTTHAFYPRALIMAMEDVEKAAAKVIVGTIKSK